MQIPVDNELLGICRQILRGNKTAMEWSEIESDDMFQTETYEGGFDATEMAFCFSVYKDKIEYWFQLSLNEIKNIVDGCLTSIDVTPALK